MPQQLSFSPDDFRDATGQRQLYIIRQLSQRLSDVETQLAQMKGQQAKAGTGAVVDSQQLDQIAAYVQRDLSVTGKHPLPLDGLVGRAHDPQLALLTVFADAIANHDAANYPVGMLAAAAGSWYVVKDGVPHTWGTAP